MPSNAERFLTAYNRIDKALKTKHRIDFYISFTRMIDRLRHKDALVQKYEIDLKQYAELRNAIVHERTEPEYWIAEPHDEVVERIEHIANQLINPELVYPKFKRSVTTFQTTDILRSVLKAIKAHQYTQFPVYEGDQFAGLLTGSGIVRWLAEKVGDDLSVIETKPLGQLLEYEKRKENCVFMNRNMSVFAAKEYFVSRMEQEMLRLEAILITENGKKNEKLLGIITPIDLIDID